jgi:PilZ domain
MPAIPAEGVRPVMRDAPNRILDFLTAPAKPAGDACRSNPRRRSSARIELAWLDGNDWRTIRARLRDISRGGAGMVARSAPPSHCPARLRVLDGDEAPWIEGEIRGVEQETPARCRIRVQFSEPCPSFLLRLAVLGAVEPAEPTGVRQGWVTWNPVASE